MGGYGCTRAPKNQFGDAILVGRMQYSGIGLPRVLTSLRFINATTSMLPGRSQHDRAGKALLKTVSGDQSPRIPTILSTPCCAKSFRLNIEERCLGKTEHSAMFRLRQLWMSHLGN